MKKVLVGFLVFAFAMTVLGIASLPHQEQTTLLALLGLGALAFALDRLFGPRNWRIDVTIKQRPWWWFF